MLEMIDTARQLVENYAKVSKGEKVLIVVEDLDFPEHMGRLVQDLVFSLGAEATLAVIKRQQASPIEPTSAVAAAMKTVNVMICIGSFGLGHTEAYNEAAVLGLRYISAKGDEAYLCRTIPEAEIQVIKKRTENLARRLSNAHRARITSAIGTDLTMSLEGRKGLSIHPLAPRGVFPDYAETAISPVEGSAEGVIVTDVEVGRWRYRLDKPLRITARSGKIVDVFGSDDADRVRYLINTDGGSSNVAELGLGTSHTIPKPYQRNRQHGGAVLGTGHIGIGRNVDLGGQTRSKVKFDLLVDKPTVEVDSKFIMKDGRLL